MKTRASSSWPSSATHANGRASASAHPDSSVVLPYPAGATTVAKGASDIRSRAIKLSFATVPGRIRGAASLTSSRSNGTLATAVALLMPASVAAGWRGAQWCMPVFSRGCGLDRNARLHATGMRQTRERAHTVGSKHHRQRQQEDGGDDAQRIQSGLRPIDGLA